MAFSGQPHAPATFVVNALPPADLPSKRSPSMSVSTTGPLCDWRAESHLHPTHCKKCNSSMKPAQPAGPKRRRNLPRTAENSFPSPINAELGIGWALKECRTQRADRAITAGLPTSCPQPPCERCENLWPVTPGKGRYSAGLTGTMSFKHLLLRGANSLPVRRPGLDSARPGASRRPTSDSSAVQRKR